MPKLTRESAKDSAIDKLTSVQNTISNIQDFIERYELIRADPTKLMDVSCAIDEVIGAIENE